MLDLTTDQQTHHMHCDYLQQKPILKLVTDGFFENIKTFVKEKVLYEHRQQQCMLAITQPVILTVLSLLADLWVLYLGLTHDIHTSERLCISYRSSICGCPLKLSDLPQVKIRDVQNKFFYFGSVLVCFCEKNADSVRREFRSVLFEKCSSVWIL